MHSTQSLLQSQTWLFNYVLNALWQLPVLFAAAWIAARLSRRAGPAFQHRLWTTALLAEVFLPAISARPDLAFQTLLHWLQALGHHTATQRAQVTVTMGPAQAESGFSLPATFLIAAAVLYLAVLLWFLARLAIGLHQTATLRRRAQPLTLTCHARQSYHHFAQLFRVTNSRVAASPDIAGPITLGIRRPTLLLPAQLDTTLLPEDLDAALAHEFAHLHRRDFAKNLAYEILSLPIAFHPFLWLTRSRIANTRELVCDRMAADAVSGTQRYAQSLLRLASLFSQRAPATTAPHAIGFFDAHPFKNFERRVMNLTHKPVELRRPARIAVTALSVLVIGGACTSALAFRQQVATPAPQTTTASPTIQVDTPPSNQAAPATIQLDVPQSDVNHVPTNVRLIPDPTTPAPHSFVLAIPRSNVEKPAPTIKVDVADAGGANPVVRVLTPTHAEPPQTSQDRVLPVTSNVLAGNAIIHTNPVYPADAKAAGIQGTVVFDAVIGKDGTLTSLKLISGPPELTKAAWEAVKQWTWKPFLLNGDPVAVDTTLTVNFSLNPAPTPTPQP